MRTFILLAALLTTINPAFAFNRQALVQAYFSVVMVRGFNDSGGMSYGSGVVVGKDEVITNCHVLRATQKPWVTLGEDSFPVTSVKADTWHDLCLVTTENLTLKPAKIGKSTTLKLGEEVAGIGHSNGVPSPLTSSGVVKGLYSDHSGNVIRTNAKFMLGASGSGLFDLEGNLVGINTFKTAGHNGAIHFALPIEWLDDLRKQPVLTTFPITGKALWEADEDKQPFYMQAAVPETQADWPKLVTVATAWTKAEPNSTEAWLALGLGEENLEHIDLAKAAYNQAVAVSPDNSDALFKLGIIAKNSGDTAEINRIQLTLNQLDKDLGDEYQAYLKCTQDCYLN